MAISTKCLWKMQNFLINKTLKFTEQATGLFMADKIHSPMFSELKKHLLLVCIICLSIMACDRSEQTQKKIVKEPALPNSDNKKTAAAAEEPLTEDSSDVDLMIARGSAYYGEKEYQKAINQFLAVYEIDKENLEIIISLGNAYYDSQQNIKAIEFYEKALEFNANNLSVRCDMATCYSRVGMAGKAIEINKKTIEMDFTHAQSHHNLAVFLKRTGKEKEAQEEMRIYNQLISSQHK